MGKITAHITIELTVADVTGAVYDAIEMWIKTNLVDKLPENADESHNYSVVP